MLCKNQAQKLAQQVIDTKIKNTINDIENKIKEAASSGQFSIQYDFSKYDTNTRDRAVAHFQSLKYDTQCSLRYNNFSIDFDEYSDHKLCLYISWLK